MLNTNRIFIRILLGGLMLQCSEKLGSARFESVFETWSKGCCRKNPKFTRFEFFV